MMGSWYIRINYEYITGSIREARPFKLNPFGAMG
jgi:hypothetical protein